MKKCISFASDEDRKKMRNLYTKAIRKAKREYERTLASSLKGGVWAAMKRKTMSSQEAIRDIEVDGVLTNDNSKIASAFKENFVHKVLSLSSPASTDVLEKVVPQVNDQWDFHVCTEKDIASIVNNMKTSKSCGPDAISSKLLKEVKYEVLPALVILVNRCLQEGIFPKCFKLGKVIPVPKSGSRKSIKNYRPITITSVLGKVVECAANQQLHNATNHHLPNTMFGFRKGLGTSDALIQLLDAIKEHRAAGDFVAILTCDASAAFDLLHHDLVISMLKRLGSGPKVTKFVESFLSGTEQFVTVNDCESDTWSLDVGSGQGHVLSPPLFNIGTLSQYFWSAYSILFGYADDGTDLVYGQTIDECNEKIRKVMAARQQWYKLAGMSLNVEKTKITGVWIQSKSTYAWEHRD